MFFSGVVRFWIFAKGPIKKRLPEGKAFFFAAG
jgi:hypothetical protein